MPRVQSMRRPEDAMTCSLDSTNKRLSIACHQNNEVRLVHTVHVSLGIASALPSNPIYSPPLRRYSSQTPTRMNMEMGVVGSCVIKMNSERDITRLVFWRWNTQRGCLPVTWRKQNGRRWDLPPWPQSSTYRSRSFPTHELAPTFPITFRSLYFSTRFPCLYTNGLEARHALCSLFNGLSIIWLCQGYGN